MAAVAVQLPGAQQLAKVLQTYLPGVADVLSADTTVTPAASRVLAAHRPGGTTRVAVVPGSSSGSSRLTFS
jgi:hypothetical protein